MINAPALKHVATKGLLGNCAKYSSTAFLAPLTIGIVTTMTNSQHYGIFIPVIVLFLIGLVLLQFVQTPKISESADA